MSVQQPTSTMGSGSALAELNNRELDVLIHERVMGLHCKLGCPSVLAESESPDSNWWRPPDDYIDLNPDGSFKTGICIPGGPIRITIPHYSTDIASAFTVVEKMRKRTEIAYVPDTTLPWMVWCCAGERTFAETLPRAISLAALSALKEKL